MNRVLYFNITYQCNNRCPFCFSHNVGTKRRDMPPADFCAVLADCLPDTKDLVILNGGEPTEHPDFLQFLAIVHQKELHCNIYSNGTHFYPEMEGNSNLSFIIPIHGHQETHDALTRREGSFEETIHTLHMMHEKNVRASIKFIISKEMCDSCFSVSDFLKEYDLQPEIVYLARMNETIKARANHYAAPLLEDTMQYLQKLVEPLGAQYSLRFLDFPPCMLPGIVDPFLDLSRMEDWMFYFSDCEIHMKKQAYWKERLVFPCCSTCIYMKLCSQLSESYYLIGQKKNSGFVLELE